MSALFLHDPLFDMWAAIILKVHLYYFLAKLLTPLCQMPNPILEMDDVPKQCRIVPLLPGSSYPHGSQYSLQWLIDYPPLHRISHCALPSNSDAAFVSHHKPKPSDLLLHYNYGVAAVKHWGRNHDVLGNCPGLPRPQPSETVAMSPTKGVGDRRTTIAKPEAAQATRGNQHQTAVNGGSTGSAAVTDHGTKMM